MATEYINKLGQLTVDEMPKAPTNFVVDIVFNEYDTQHNFTWVNKSTEETLPIEIGYIYSVDLQEYSPNENTWGSIYDETNTPFRTSQSILVDYNGNLRKYRIALIKTSTTDYTIKEVYASQTIAAPCNNVIAEASYDIAIANYNEDGYNDGEKYVDDVYENYVRKSVGGWIPIISCVNPNVGKFYGKQYLFTNSNLLGYFTSQRNLMDFNQMPDYKLGYDIARNPLQIEMHVVIENNGKNVISESYQIQTNNTVDDIPDFAPCYDLYVAYSNETEAVLHWSNGDETSGKIIRMNGVSYKDAGASNAKYLTNQDSWLITRLTLGNTYTFYIYNTKCGIRVNSETITYTHSN